MSARYTGHARKEYERGRSDVSEGKRPQSGAGGHHNHYDWRKMQQCVEAYWNGVESRAMGA